MNFTGEQVAQMAMATLGALVLAVIVAAWADSRADGRKLSTPRMAGIVVAVFTTVTAISVGTVLLTG